MRMTAIEAWRSIPEVERAAFVAEFRRNNRNSARGAALAAPAIANMRRSAPSYLHAPGARDAKGVRREHARRVRLSRIVERMLREASA